MQNSSAGTPQRRPDSRKSRARGRSRTLWLANRPGYGKNVFTNLSEIQWERPCEIVAHHRIVAEPEHVGDR